MMCQRPAAPGPVRDDNLASKARQQAHRRLVDTRGKDLLHTTLHQDYAFEAFAFSGPDDPSRRERFRQGVDGARASIAFNLPGISP